MRLTRLELCGFKSFLDKTSIHFKPGITAIVGPNGCGKSNLTDAVSWVLGEQRPKALRGERMEDVIFNGTEDRKPLGMAEVSVTVGDIRDPLPSVYSPYTEITFMRRLHRSGESEYFINQVPCRLKDIRDLLMDLKAGHRAIIEQGRIDDLLTASPLKRRELIEEVAGISKYRVRKEEAIRKLTATEQNLLRIRDILSEVKRQINTLDRQAKAAEKYKRLYEEVKSYDLYITATEWKNWTDRHNALSQDERSLRERLTQYEADAASLDLKISTLQLALAEKETALLADKEQMANQTYQIGKAEARIERIFAQRKEWQETQTQIQEDMSAIHKAQSDGTDALRLLAEEHQKVNQERLAIEGDLAQADAEATERAQTLLMTTHALEKERTELFDVASRLAAAHNNLLHYDTRHALLVQKKEQGSVRLSEIRQKQIMAQEALQKLQNEGEAVEQQGVKIRERHQSLLARLATLETQQKEHEEAFYKWKSEEAHVRAERSSKEGFYRGHLGPMADTAFRPESASLLADLLEVPEAYEKAIEAVLGERLRGQVVEGLPHLQEGILKLQSLKKGRGLLILHDLAGSETRAFVPPENLPDGVIGSAFSFVTCKAGYEGIVKRLLDGFYLVRDTETALSLMGRFVGLVTLQGELFCNGVVAAGEIEQDQSLLNQKREMAVLSREVNKLHDLAEEQAVKIEEIQKEQQVVRTSAAEITAEAATIETQRMTLQKEIQAHLLENEKLALTDQALRSEYEEDTREQETLAQKAADEKTVLAALRALHEEKERKLSEGLSEQARLQDAHQVLKERCVALQLSVTTLREQGKHRLEKKEQTERSLESLARSCADKEMLLGLLQKKWADAEREEKEAQIEIETIHADCEQLLEQIRHKTEEQTELSGRVESLRAEARKTQWAKEQTLADINEKSVQIVEAKMAEERICETILTQYQIDLTQTDATAFHLPPSWTQEEGRGDAEEHKEVLDPLSPGERDDVMANITQARDKLRVALNAIGPVHLGAIEEYQELTQRHQFLKSQESDLVASMDDLKAAISKINQTTHSLFHATFHALNAHFTETFASFFGGGKAELVLEDLENPMESGISILAAPPGKKPRTLNLLSGGEKALTALSLLFSTFMVEASPPRFQGPGKTDSEAVPCTESGSYGGAYPFCILDEVDAALDEENARRFADAIERLSERSQFVIVTHNKQTMQKADILYGVTAEHPGISKLVSVSLREIESGSITIGKSA